MSIRSAFAKAFTTMRHPGRSFVLFNSPRRSDADIRKDVGDGTAANVVMAPIRWLQRSFIESPVVVFNGEEPDDEHEAATLIRRPNNFYSGEHLFFGTILSLCVDGNAYWLVVSNGRGKPVQLWYVPHHMIEPKFPDDGSEFITHYEYTVGGRKTKLAVDDVVHFREGIDPDNVRKGLSPLKALMREVWTDMECSNMVSALLKNGGVPGVVISPDSEDPIDPDDAAATKEYVNKEFTRENRGKSLVLTGRTKVQTFGFSPRELDLSAIRNISEERVTASLGVPAAVVGFGTGVEQTKVGATLKELRKIGWENGVIPMQNNISGELNNTLLPMFGPSPNRVIGFDRSRVTALQEDENERVERVSTLVKNGLWTRGEGREATGQEVTPADDVFLQPFNVMQVPRSGQAPVGPEQRSRKGYKSEHSLTEERIAAEAPRLDNPPQVLLSLANRLDQIRRDMPAAMQADLEAFFIELGDAAADAAIPFIKSQIEADQIVEGMGMADRLPIFGRIYERAALRVSTEVDAAISEAMGVEVGLPDPQARAVVAAMGTRSGLVDLDGQTRRAVFDSLVEGRAEGEAGDTLARRIRGKVASGPWSSPAIRARVIARTETAFAVNKSSVETARKMESERMLVFDDRIGYGDAVCSDMDGAVVTLQEAEQLMADEHPNGTRSFSPLPPGLVSSV